MGEGVRGKRDEGCCDIADFRFPLRVHMCRDSFSLVLDFIFAGSYEESFAPIRFRNPPLRNHASRVSSPLAFLFEQSFDVPHV